MPMSPSFFLFQVALSVGVMAFYGYLAWVVARSQSRIADATEELAKNLKSLRAQTDTGKPHGQTGGLFGEDG